jgi:transcriptional regulator with XRE-family HTH domain
MIKGQKQRRNEVAIATVGRNIKKYRLSKGMTMEDLANRVEVDYSQISRMERGKVNATVSIIYDVASA